MAKTKPGKGARKQCRIYMKSECEGMRLTVRAIARRACSLQELAKAQKVHVRNVDNYLRFLAAAGMIERVPAKPTGKVGRPALLWKLAKGVKIVNAESTDGNVVSSGRHPDRSAAKRKARKAKSKRSSKVKSKAKRPAKAKSKRVTKRATKRPAVRRKVQKLTKASAATPLPEVTEKAAA